MRPRLFKIPQLGIQVNTLNEDDYMLGVFGDENRSIAKFDSKVGKIQSLGNALAWYPSRSVHRSSEIKRNRFA